MFTRYNRIRNISVFFGILILAVFFSKSALQAKPVQVGHVEAELVSEMMSVTPGQPFWVGLHLHLDPDWHVYWRNPGDAGTPPRLNWQLPDGFRAGEIQWPVPEKIVQPPLVDFGYNGEVLLPVQIFPPDNLKPGETINLKANASWLVCREVCIPGDADLSLQLPIVSGDLAVNEKVNRLFARTRNQLPVTLLDWHLSARVATGGYAINIQPPAWFKGPLNSLDFYPYDKMILDYIAAPTIDSTVSGFTLHLKKSHYQMQPSDTLRGLLINPHGWRGAGSETAMAVSIPVGAKKDIAGGSVAASTGLNNLWLALLFAFLGGLILNLMPCVLPVLSIKILSFVKEASDHKGRALSGGLMFSAGILVSFWILAGTLIALRAGGEQLGWGFQLQSPIFLTILASFIFLFGLSLLGVFEIGTSLTGAGNIAASRSGRMSSFLSGVTAVVVATPCTAPFMGSALGYALSQSYVVSLAIFSALGLGLALPYVILSASPRLMRFVPRPGPWMETLKHIMGFLLMATVVWLSWVLALQAGATAIALFLMGLVLLGVGAWLWGRWGTPVTTGRLKVAARVLTVFFLLAGFGIGLYGTSFDAPITAKTNNSDGLAWESFSQKKLDQLTASGQPVFVDFTAAWCLSCQVNEKVALNSEDVVKKFEELGVATLKADWTSYNEEITKALAEHGRNSVPLYVLYIKGKTNSPIILPEILTPGVVLKALENIKS